MAGAAIFLFCRSKAIAEYALRHINSPIAISTHRLLKQLQDSLPTIEQLEMELNTVVSDLVSDGSSFEED